MNWYIDNAGAAEGPYDDAAMTGLAQKHSLDSDSLVWHAGLDAWASVAAISPAWWGAALPEPVKAAPPAAKSRKKASAPETESTEEQPMTITTLRAQSATSVTPKRRLAAPVAPSEKEPEQQSGGLLKKLFSFGKKKK
jgi:hypothetical protein